MVQVHHLWRQSIPPPTRLSACSLHGIAASPCLQLTQAAEQWSALLQRAQVQLTLLLSQSIEGDSPCHSSLSRYTVVLSTPVTTFQVRLHAALAHPVSQAAMYDRTTMAETN